jgi:hypothetical protein
MPSVRTYVEQCHLSAIPIKPDGLPPPNWYKFTRHKPGSQDIAHWERVYPGAGVAIVTGRVSGLVALLVDGWKFGVQFDRLLRVMNNMHNPFYFTPTIETPHGWTILFKHPGHEVPKLLYRGGAMTLLGDGHYVVAPSSNPAHTVAYRWMHGRTVESTIPQAIPDWIIDHFPGY